MDEFQKFERVLATDATARAVWMAGTEAGWSQGAIYQAVIVALAGEKAELIRAATERLMRTVPEPFRLNDRYNGTPRN